MAFKYTTKGLFRSRIKRVTKQDEDYRLNGKEKKGETMWNGTRKERFGGEYVCVMCVEDGYKITLQMGFVIVAQQVVSAIYHSVYTIGRFDAPWLF